MAAMSAVNFEMRPVAGIAGKIELLGSAKPGETLELQADLESVDKEAVVYDGAALVNGIPILRLEHCVGPMLPMEQFEDPQVARDRFALLCERGAEPSVFSGVPAISGTRIAGETGKWLRANLEVFADAIEGRAEYPISTAQMVDVIAGLEAIVTSMRSGNAVALTE